MNSKAIAYLRSLAHTLNPVVRIGNKGLSASVIKEIELNLNAHELIKIKIQSDKDRLIANFDGDPLIQVLNGRYGPFIQVSPVKVKKINVKIPKGTEPKDLTREDCISLWENQPAKKPRGKKKK